MENTLFKRDTMFTVKEVLTYYYNMFTDSLVANCIDLEHYRTIKKNNPEYKKMDQMTGQLMTVDMLIESKQKGIVFARGNRDYISSLIDKDASGEVSNIWSDESIDLKKPVLSPMQKGTEEKGIVENEEQVGVEDLDNNEQK